jgi:hypothetical protein
MADRADPVKEKAWEQLLSIDPGAFQINADTVIQLLTDTRTSRVLVETGCLVVARHRVVAATNALKELADDKRASRKEKKTIGELARDALLEIWPDAAAWIRMTHGAASVSDRAQEEAS